MALDEGGRIYSYKPSSQGTQRKHLKLLYKVEPTTKINYSIEWFTDSKVNFRTCILELKTNDDRVFQLKAKDPLLLQNWAQRIQRFLASSRSKSGEYGFFVLWVRYVQGTKADGPICGYGQGQCRSSTSNRSSQIDTGSCSSYTRWEARYWHLSYKSSAKVRSQR